MKSDEWKLVELVKVSEAAPLLKEKRCQVVGAAKSLVAWSHEGRVCKVVAFAFLVGGNPLPASSAIWPAVSSGLWLPRPERKRYRKPFNRNRRVHRICGTFVMG